MRIARVDGDQLVDIYTLYYQDDLRSTTVLAEIANLPPWLVIGIVRPATPTTHDSMRSELADIFEQTLLLQRPPAVAAWGRGLLLFDGPYPVIFNGRYSYQLIGNEDVYVFHATLTHAELTRRFGNFRPSADHREPAAFCSIRAGDTAG